jgi:uncharacterized membrane-anchored protein YitT (DUF2179 family)
MAPTGRQILKQVQDYVMIFLGLLSYAFGFTAFVLPEKVVTGGVTGLSSLLFFGLGWNVAITYYGINILLLAIAYRSVGRQFVIRTIIGATLATLMLGVLQPLFTAPIVAQQPFMNIIIGAIFCGVGIGTVFVHNGSTAGTDIVAAMVTKYTTISFGRMMLYMDLIIITSSYVIFHSVDKIVYGIIFMIINSQVTDMVINNTRQTVQFFIISKHWEDIANAINNEANRGCTVLNGMGWYSKDDVKVLMVMCRKMESVHVFRIIKRIDTDAFISQANVNGVYGQGFDQVKVRLGKSDVAQAEHDAPPPGATETS